MRLADNRGRVWRPAGTRANVPRHFPHRLDGLQRLRRPLFQVAPRHTEESIADRTLQHASYDPATLVQHAFGFIA